ncbi:MAG: hypothetical protein LC687_02055 [Actinobacteria bacterium]|nr:hypothetical protein [Actinomycetota bacterium]
METLSSAIEKFNLDKNPLESLDPRSIKTAVSKVPPSRKNLPAVQNLTVARTETHPQTGQSRLPFRLADAGKLIVDAVAMGSTYHLACAYAGISLPTFYNWLNRAEVILQRLEAEMSMGEAVDPVISQAEIIYIDFYMRLKQAEGEAVIGWLKVINEAAQEGKWQAATWMLERRHPGDYGKQTQVHQHHTKGQAVTVDEWKRGQKKRLEEANEILAEFVDVTSSLSENGDDGTAERVLGTSVDQPVDASRAED